MRNITEPEGVRAHAQLGCVTVSEISEPANSAGHRSGQPHQAFQPERILDVGCGPGNSTRVLKDRFSHARVIGIDNSENMIEKAKADHPDMEFRLCDVSGDLAELEGDYDIVFSNACLQWVPNHHQLLKKLMDLLRKNGVLAVQIPYNMREPIHRILEELSASAGWRAYFPQERVYNTLTQRNISISWPISRLNLIFGRRRIIT